jgi:hypothetical protein
MIAIFLSILSPVMSLIDFVVPYDIAPLLARILGNTLLLDNMLPITEAYALVVVALTFKLAIFSYKVVWIVIDFTKYVSSYIRGVRM